MLEYLLLETKDILEKTEKETGLKVRLYAKEQPYQSKTSLSSFYEEPKDEIALIYNPKLKSIELCNCP